MSVKTYVKNGVELLQSDAVPGAFCHGFSTRFGGVSQGCLESLNLGIHRGDTWENVEENYRRFGGAVGFSPEQTVFTHQVHGPEILAVTAADCGTGLYRPQQTPCDGLITDEPGVALTVFGADCTTMVLWDSVRKVVCAVHSGWRGTAAGIAAQAVERMVRDYGCARENIGAAIGPCIGKCCFETRQDVPEAMEQALGSAAAPFIVDHGNGTYHVDLKGINAHWLKAGGVRVVDVAPDCTACRPDRFWSHRKVGDRRGSLAAVIMIRK